MKLKKIFATILAVALVLALGVGAFAAGNEGSITIQNSVLGKQYDLYRIFDLTYTGEGSDVSAAYTIAENWKAFFNGDGAQYIVDTDAAGMGLNQINIGGTMKYIDITESNIADFAQAALAYAAQKLPDRSVTGTGGDVVAGGLPLGYYLVYPEGATEIKDSYASICSITNTVPDGTVVVKSEYPTIDKEITGKGKTNTAAIGDAVPFTVTGKVPDMTGYTHYIYNVVDTLSKGLTYNEDIVVKIGENTLQQNTHYTVAVTTDAEGKTELKIVFKDFIQHKDAVGEEICITYSATLNEQAEIGTTANPNEVKLIYSNDPKDTGMGDEPDPTTPTGETPVVTTETYTTQIKLVKVYGADNSKTLTGAKFELTGDSAKATIVNDEIFEKDDNGTYYMLKDGTFTTEAPTGDETHDENYDSTTQKYAKVSTVNKETEVTKINRAAYVNADGVLTFAGLGEGTHTITELVAPAGYNLLAQPITVTISFDETNKTWSATGATVEGDVLKIVVENNTGSKLPETGGIGATIFYVLGGFLMAGAIIVLVARKKMSDAR